MPFNASDLTALTAANGFTLWHYRTPDARALVVAPGYFAAAEPPLLPGDIIIVQAADATALVPIRGSALAGGGVTVDLAGLTPNLLRSAMPLAPRTPAPRSRFMSTVSAWSSRLWASAMTSAPLLLNAS